MTISQNLLIAGLTIATIIESHPLHAMERFKIQAIKPWGTLQGHCQTVSSIATLSKNGQDFVVSGSTDGSIKIWDMNAEKCIRTLDGKFPATDFTWITVKILAGDNGKTFIAGNVHSEIILWDFDTGEMYKKFEIYPEDDDDKFVCCFQPLDHNRIAFGISDGTIEIWDIDTGSCSITLNYPSLKNFTLMTWALPAKYLVRLDEEHLAAGYGEGEGSVIALWNTKTGEVKSFELAGESISSLLTVEKDLLISGYLRGRLKILNWKTGEWIPDENRHYNLSDDYYNNYSTDMASFDADKIIATFSNKICIFNYKTQEIKNCFSVGKQILAGSISYCNGALVCAQGGNETLPMIDLFTILTM